MQLYYSESPSNYEGYATNAGGELVALRSLRWYAKELIDQFEFNGYALIGGGYGFVWIDGKRYLIQNRSSRGYYLEYSHSLNKQQQLLYKLGKMSDKDFNIYVNAMYSGIISTKSPNDLGRVYCLYNKNNYLGKYIVGDHAANNDWLPYGASLNDTYGHDRLGYRLGRVGDKTYPWVVDLTNKKFSQLYDKKNLVIIRLEEDCKRPIGITTTLLLKNKYLIN